jgi:hypothetical protein
MSFFVNWAFLGTRLKHERSEGFKASLLSCDADVFFLITFPFHRTGLSGTLRSACCFFFLSFFPLCAAGLRGTFPGHPRPPSLLLFPFWTTQHEIQHKHSWEAHPARDLNPADLAVVSEECRSLFLPPPYRQPLIDIHTHPWPGGGSFLGKNPPPSVRFEPTSAGTATSEHCLRQPCSHRATYDGFIFDSFI